MIQVTIPSPLPPFLELFNHPILKAQEKPPRFLRVVAHIGPSGHPCGVFLACGSMPWSSRMGHGHLLDFLLHASPFPICRPRFCPMSSPSRCTSPSVYGPSLLRANTASRSSAGGAEPSTRSATASPSAADPSAAGPCHSPSVP